ncbi:MAG: prephenate dehydrogenase [Thaumarchaeota archaeon]|jgi:prephenate dehydrogenase|nr:prephenate dehydrogenase [Candidatus Geocrenenecus arthurdayi]
MIVSVIGLGAFGRWLTRQFHARGFQVKGFDIDPGKIEELRSSGINGYSSLREAIEDSDIILVAVPINRVSSVLEEVSKHLARGVVIDVSSLKKPVYSIMKSFPENLKPVCIHPLFGPTASGFKNEKVALIPVRDSLEERRIVESLMPGVEIIEVTVDEHDDAMVYILSLTHLLSIAITNILKEVKDGKIIEELSGASFKHMCRMLNATLTESPDTFTSILYYNSGTKQLSLNLLRQFNEITQTISREDYTNLRKMVEEKLGIYSKLDFVRKIASS